MLKWFKFSMEDFHIGYFSNIATICCILLAHEYWKSKLKVYTRKVHLDLGFISVKNTLKVLLIDKNLVFEVVCGVYEPRVLHGI